MLMERETRFELATPALARQCSTTELFPHTQLIYIIHQLYIIVKLFKKSIPKLFLRLTALL